MNHSSTLKEQKGLTLVEALVTLLVLSMGIIPSVAVLSFSTRISSLIKNNLIAANLAQEGVEIVRSVRDKNWFANGNPPWDRHLHDCGGANNDCDREVQWDTGGPLLNLVSNPPLQFNSATGRYSYDGGIDTIFRRSVKITKTADPCGCELIVMSTVDWTQYGRTRTQNVEAHLFNWK